MKVRHKLTGALGYSHRFNISTIGEMVVNFDDGGTDSAFIREYEVLLLANETCGEGVWKDLQEAFEDNDVITDNLNTTFFEPRIKKDKERGFAL